jgi:hypothetical protein
MKTITITINNRPQYLKQVLDSLRKNDILSYDIMYCALEPGCEENIEICKSIDFIESRIFLNEEKKGVRLNPYFILDKVFNNGSEYNVYLEDDSILSPDAFELANFYYDYFKNSEYLLCSFYNDLRRYDENEISKVIEWNDFVAIGFSLFKDSWNKWLRTYWFNDTISKEENIGGIGWDWSIRAVMKRFNLKTITPCLPRSMHIGKEGTFCSRMDYIRLFGDKVFCGEKIGRFYKEDLRMMKIIRNCYNNKLCDVIEKDKTLKKICIMFNHGLGDFINFLPLFESIVKTYPNIEFSIGFSPNRNFKFLHKKGRIIDAPYGKYENDFDLIIGLQYPEPPRTDVLKKYYEELGIKNVNTITKPELCNEMEIGLNNFEWKQYKFKVKKNSIKRVGVHFFGHALAKDKNVDIDVAEKIWNEIKLCGFTPFEIQMIPIDYITQIENPDFIDNTIRYKFPNIRIMFEELTKCDFFFGIDSGPLYLAGSILGFNKVRGLEKNIKFAKMIPYNIISIDVAKYKNGSVENELKGIVKSDN